LAMLMTLGFLPCGNLLEMPVVNLVCLGNQLLVEPFLTDTGFIAAQQENGRPIRIKCEGDPQHLILRSGSELLHIGVPGAFERVRVWPSKLRAHQPQ
jgi:hypothetical protein